MARRGDTTGRRWSHIGLVLLTMGLLWWQFGFSVVETNELTVVTRRVFGRVTRIHVFDRSWRERERLLFPWLEPFEHGDPITECAAIFPKHWQDRNRDGRWDTWLSRVGPDASGR